MTQPTGGYPQDPANPYATGQPTAPQQNDPGQGYPAQDHPAQDYQPVDEVPVADHRDELNRKALDDVKHTRTRALWVGLIVGAIITLLLLIFIVQNVDSQSIHLLFWTVDLPLGVSLLIAAILGAVITGIVGSLRMYQVRRAVKKAQA